MSASTMYRAVHISISAPTLTADLYVYERRCIKLTLVTRASALTLPVFPEDERLQVYTSVCRSTLACAVIYIFRGHSFNPNV